MDGASELHSQRKQASQLCVEQALQTLPNLIFFLIVLAKLRMLCSQSLAFSALPILEP